MEEIEGFNAWYKGADPSFLREVMLTGINVPIRIGDAVACPGDIVLAKKEGIVFIPAHMVEQVVTSSERTRVRDAFGHMRLKEGKYTPGQIDSTWSQEINEDFNNFQNINKKLNILGSELTNLDINILNVEKSHLYRDLISWLKKQPIWNE